MVSPGDRLSDSMVPSSIFGADSLEMDSALQLDAQFGISLGEMGGMSDVDLTNRELISRSPSPSLNLFSAEEDVPMRSSTPVYWAGDLTDLSQQSSSDYGNLSSTQKPGRYASDAVAVPSQPIQTDNPRAGKRSSLEGFGQMSSFDHGLSAKTLSSYRHDQTVSEMLRHDPRMDESRMDELSPFRRSLPAQEVLRLDPRDVDMSSFRHDPRSDSLSSFRRDPRADVSSFKLPRNGVSYDDPRQHDSLASFRHNPRLEKVSSSWNDPRSNGFASLRQNPIMNGTSLSSFQQNQQMHSMGHVRRSNDIYDSKVNELSSSRHDQMTDQVSSLRIHGDSSLRQMHSAPRVWFLVVARWVVTVTVSGRQSVGDSG